MLIPTDIEKDIIYSFIFDDFEKFLETSSKSSLNIENMVSIISSNRIEYFFLNKINSKFKFSELPADFFKQLEICYLKRSIPTLKNIEKIFLLSDKLQKNNLDHVFLKGLALYDNTNKYTRPMRDIDILVNPKDLIHVVNLAKSLDFRFKNANLEQSDSYITSSSFYDLPQMIDSSGVILEIHFRITTGSNNCLLKENIFASKKLIKVHGKNIYAPCPNSLFIHLAYHASKKGNFDVGLSALIDLIQLYDRVDKDNVLRISESIKLKKISELFFELIEFKKNKKIILSENAEKLKEILIIPTVNSKITEIFIKDNFFQKTKEILRLLFVSNTHIRREFGLQKKFYFYLHPLRWVRQIKQFYSSIFYTLVNYSFVFRRARIIKELIKENTTIN